MACDEMPTALDDQDRLSQEADDAQDSAQELSADVELSAAKERPAASEAWLHYIERCY